MKSLITIDNGGFPFVLDDLRWMDAGVQEALKGGFSFLGNNYLISGGSLTNVGGINFDVAEGWIMWNGEIRYLKPSSALDYNQFWHIDEVVEYDSAGDKTFENGSAPHRAYENRQLIVNAYSAIQSTPQFRTFPVANQIIRNLLLNSQNRFTALNSWKQGTDGSLGSGGLLTFGAAPIDGNVFNINCSGNVPLQAFNAVSSSLPDGTFIALRFTGGNVTVSEPASGAFPVQTGGRAYLFEEGSVAMFVALDSKMVLINGSRLAPQWFHVGGAGAPAYASGVTAASPDGVRFRRDASGRVTIVGDFNYTHSGGNVPIFMLPVGFRPTYPVSLWMYNTAYGAHVRIDAMASGQILAIAYGASSGASVDVNFGVFNFLTD